MTEGHSVQETYDLLIKDSAGPYAFSAQSMEPHNKCQLYKVNLKSWRQSKPNGAGEVGEDLSNLLWDLKSMDVVETTIVKRRCYFFNLSMERQVRMTWLIGVKYSRYITLCDTNTAISNINNNSNCNWHIVSTYLQKNLSWITNPKKIHVASW